MPKAVDFNRPDCADVDGRAHFFASNTFGSERKSSVGKSWNPDAGRRDEYSQRLRQFSEPSLSCAARQAEEYRFVLEGTMIHVTLPDDSSSPATILIDTHGHEGPWTYLRTRRVLSYDDQCDLLTSLWRADFWRLARDDSPPQPSTYSSYIVEGRRGARYHAVERVVHEGSVDEIREAFWRIARLPSNPGAR